MAELAGPTMSKRSRSWPGGGGGGAKLPARRLVSLLMCRLPFLTLWTLVVIFILYKSLSNTDLKQSAQDASELQANLPSPTAAAAAASSQVPLNNPTQAEDPMIENHQSLIRRSHPQQHDEASLPTGRMAAETSSTPSVITNHPEDRAAGSVVVSTTKKATEEYVRQSKVFILIVQNEDLRSSIPGHSNRRSSSSSSSSSIPSGVSGRRLTVAPRIRLLIDILESHRIEYTIDSTRTGLPTTLLRDQDSSSENKQYSVIIIDDFIKYTKLNRWVRDQLDRHCRTNQIGVITYLTADELERQKLDVAHIIGGRNVGHILSRRNRASTTEESLADQFPLTFKLIDKQSCHNSTATCLINYQLNERSPILRILKRRQNFILHGDLAANLNQSPWVSMSSNHITYEPLTWARLRRPSSSEVALQRAPRYASDGITRENDQGPLQPGARLWSRDEYANETLDQIDDYSAMHENNGNQFQALADQRSASIDNSDGDDQAYSWNETSPLSASSSSSSSPPPLMDYNPNNGDDSDGDDGFERQVLSMFDRGLYDGIKRVIFGGENHHWLNRILFLDAIEHLSSGRILTPLERYIQIDIDDMFVGAKGKRMNRSDVDALVETQREFSRRIDGGFKFNLGFSGKYFKHGYDEENAGDEHIISRASEFTWFCHTWSHSKAHLFNDSESIKAELRKNLIFAREKGLPIIGHLSDGGSGNANDTETTTMPPTYAIAPHHSGVYPIHEQLYEAWNQVLNVQVTSTEEYPRLMPANGRRAFVHKTIKVLPRQTCGLYTHTIYKRKYPGGFGKLEANIRGGELFETILHNPVNIYMTHMSNYAQDRLAPYTFSALFDFVQTNTNLQLKFAASNSIDQPLGPAKLADYYLNLYPDERQPLWTNPCNDKRHMAIWAPSKHDFCSTVPKLLIVGPQKTGTTALYTFLKANPLFKSSQMSPIDFEEVQFFNDKHYYKGVDWYFSRFRPTEGETLGGRAVAPTPKDAEGHYYFEKSATYFDDPKAPGRASYLLPKARIVMLLVNPADRAYSWYQHVKAHGDPTANSMTFEQVITSKDDDPKVSQAMRSLRSRCLHPGYYSQHLSKWLEHYPSRQIIIIDGQWFRHNPASVMNRLQLLLRVDQSLDYNKLLFYDQRKGFYCLLGQQSSSLSHHSELNCLGKSKGRKYAPMSQEARSFLNRHYWPHNRQLARLLSDIGQPLPTWLDEVTMSVGHVIY